MPDHILDSPHRSDEAGARRSVPILDVEVRDLRTEREYAACVALQKETWGEQFSERVPLSILKVSQRIGGIVAGAFDAEDRLLGFVFGMTGVEGGQLVHWSDMLAVRAEARNLGIGRRLKEFQKAALLRIGVEKVYWTFDPLVSRNAHLNLNRLGAKVVEYVSNMYGDTDSSLQRGLGTDRFVVVWEIASAGSAAGLSLPPPEVGDAPVVNGTVGNGAHPIGIGPVLAAAPVVRIRIPLDIRLIQASSLEEAGRWRETTRQAFSWCLERGFRVTGFTRDGAEGPCYYVLSKTDPHERKEP